MIENDYKLNDLTVHIHFVLDKATYPGWEDIRNMVNVHSLYWIHEGKGVFLTNVEHKVEAGMLIYLKPGLKLSMRSQMDAPLRITMLLFDCAELSYDAVWKEVKPIGKLRLPFLSQYNQQQAEEISQLVWGIHQDWLPGLTDGIAVSRAKMQILLHKLHQTVQPDWNLMESGAFSAFEQIKKTLENDYKDHHRIEKLAEKYGISPSYLRKMFLKFTGMGPKEYHMHLQNQQACRYLVFTDYPVKEIAKLCGYYEEYHFSKIFKQLNGIPPTVYRNKQRIKD
ncbi:helix-turn-helix transcriptional regulator [Paenibacillus sp. FSL H7-0323]|uniref:helix-turn-helix transcriptional regulator n=1 Tax=Paenibacillus sp. FSL H7-0323 TaxID=2921433 RepID=UPI0030F4E083